MAKARRLSSTFCLLLSLLSIEIVSLFFNLNLFFGYRTLILILINFRRVLYLEFLVFQWYNFKGNRSVESRDILYSFDGLLLVTHSIIPSRWFDEEVCPDAAKDIECESHPDQDYRLVADLTDKESDVERCDGVQCLEECTGNGLVFRRCHLCQKCEPEDESTDQAHA